MGNLPAKAFRQRRQSVCEGLASNIIEVFIPRFQTAQLELNWR
jgi:hypothetical protein